MDIDEPTDHPLEAVDGLSEADARALRSVDVATSRELARCSPKRLARLVSEATEHAVSEAQVAAWIDEAAALVGSTRSEAPPGASANDDEWRTVAEFIVSFDDRDLVDRPDRRVRIHDTRTGEHVAFDQSEPATWTGWILERVPDPPVRTGRALAPSDLHDPRPATQVTALSVHELPDETGGRTLLGEVRFRLIGDAALEQTDERAPYQVEIVGLERASREVAFLVQDQSSLQPGRLSYEHRLSFPIPQVGSYEIRGSAFLIPRFEAASWTTGPMLTVVP